MRYGFTMPGRGPLAKPESLAAIAKHGEELGYDMLTVSDHIVVPREISSTYPYSQGGEFPGSAFGETLETLTFLSFLVGQTSRVRLGTSVMIVPHRSPVVTAKALATLDVLSQGRVVVGVGAGWMREEFEVLELPPFEERGAVTDEYILAFKELWTSDNPHFEGKYCRFSNLTFLPKPVQKPHPPIWVGGESRRALRRAAELGDGWFPIGANPAFPMGRPEQLRQGIERLASMARQAGRQPSEIEIVYRTHDYEIRNESVTESRIPRTPFVGNAEQIASDIRQYEQMGVTSLSLDFTRMSRTTEEALDHMEQMATQVWPKV